MWWTPPPPPPPALPAETTPYPLYTRLGGPHGRSWRVRKISLPPGFDPRAVQPVASRYTDWAIAADKEEVVHIECSFLELNYRPIGGIFEEEERLKCRTKYRLLWFMLRCFLCSTYRMPGSRFIQAMILSFHTLYRLWLINRPLIQSYKSYQTQQEDIYIITCKGLGRMLIIWWSAALSRNLLTSERKNAVIYTELGYYETRF